MLRLYVELIKKLILQPKCSLMITKLSGFNQFFWILIFLFPNLLFAQTTVQLDTTYQNNKVKVFIEIDSDFSEVDSVSVDNFALVEQDSLIVFSTHYTMDYSNSIHFDYIFLDETSNRLILGLGWFDRFDPHIVRVGLYRNGTREELFSDTY